MVSIRVIKLVEVEANPSEEKGGNWENRPNSTGDKEIPGCIGARGTKGAGALGGTLLPIKPKGCCIFGNTIRKEKLKKKPWPRGHGTNPGPLSQGEASHAWGKGKSQSVGIRPKLQRKDGIKKRCSSRGGNMESLYGQSKAGCGDLSSREENGGAQRESCDF